MNKLIATLLLTTATAVTAVNASAASTYSQTRYPLVLSHGLFGFNKIGPVGYWYGIPEELKDSGAKVFVTAQAPTQSNDVRGEQLLQQVRDIIAITGAGKVNLIGHSQGGMSVRYVAGVAPQLVASVTTVGAPHKGAPTADQVLGLSTTLGPTLTGVAAGAVNWLTNLLDIIDGGATQPQDVMAAVADLSTAGSLAFNARFPAGVPTSACGQGDAVTNGIRNYSWSGNAPKTNILDPIDLIMTPMDVASDGVVPVCSSHFGMVIRDTYKMNHFDEVNQVLGLVALFETSPKAVFREHANRLKLAGL